MGIIPLGLIKDIGLLVGSLFGLIIFIVISVFVYKRRRRKRLETEVTQLFYETADLASQVNNLRNSDREKSKVAKVYR